MFSDIAFSRSKGILNFPFLGESPLIFALKNASGPSFCTQFTESPSSFGGLNLTVELVASVLIPAASFGPAWT